MRSISPPPATGSSTHYGNQESRQANKTEGTLSQDGDLHRERPVDEVGRLVVDVFHLDDHPLVVRICITTN